MGDPVSGALAKWRSGGQRLEFLDRSRYQYK